MNTVKRFNEIKDLLWDSLDAIVVSENGNTEFRLDLKSALPEVRLVRAMFLTDDLGELTVNGIMVSDTGFILSVPFTAKNIITIGTIANKYGLKIKKTTFI